MLTLKNLKEMQRLNLGKGKARLRLVVRDRAFMNVQKIGEGLYHGHPVWIMAPRKDGKNKGRYSVSYNVAGRL